VFGCRAGIQRNVGKREERGIDRSRHGHPEMFWAGLGALQRQNRYAAGQLTQAKFANKIFTLQH